MSELWNAGTFLSKAKELSQRLKYWHQELVPQPLRVVTEAEWWEYESVTLRGVIPESHRGNRSKSIRIRFAPNTTDQPQGVLTHIPDRIEDHSITRWELCEFRCQLRELKDPLHAVDYLKRTFDLILDSPAHAIRPAHNLAEKSMLGDQGSKYFLVNHPIKKEYIDGLVDAAEKLFAATKPPAAANSARSNTVAGSSKKKSKGKNINAQMLAKIQDDPEAIYWSTDTWAQVLDCAKSSVCDTDTWKNICGSSRETKRLETGKRPRKRKADH